MRSRIEPMKKIARTLRQRRQLILNYFRAQKLFSSGVVEGLNALAPISLAEVVYLIEKKRLPASAFDDSRWSSL